MKKIKNEKGTITLEACVVVPIFIFLIMFVYGFMVMFLGTHAVSHALVQCAESMSLDSYATDMLSHDGDATTGSVLISVYGSVARLGSENFSSDEKWYDGGDVGAEAENRFIGFIADGDESNADEWLEMFGIKGGCDGLDFSGSNVTDGVLTINVKYTQEFVYGTEDISGFDRDLTVKAKMW